MRFLYILLLAATAFACAKQTSPTGGPKDEIPPKLIRSNPADQTTNYKGNTIELEFDEYVQLDNARNKIFLTPAIEKKVESIAKKNKIIVTIPEKLKHSTTYTINFLDAVQDITEKNPATNLKLAFSTGNIIDTLSITGKVYDILKGEPVKEYTVALVNQVDTFDIFKHKAQWISITDKEGNFELENLKAGNYFLYTFNDKNKNLIVDSKSEAYGFQSEIVELTENKSNITLQTFSMDSRPLEVQSVRTIQSTFDIRLNKSIIQFEFLAPEDSALRLVTQLDENQSVIKIYDPKLSVDSLMIQLTAKDSLNSSIDTTLYAKWNKENTRFESFSTKIESAIYSLSSTEFNGKLVFSKPVNTVNTDSIYIQLDSLNKINFMQNDLQWNDERRQLTINKKFEFPKTDEETKPVYKPRLYTKIASFTSIENDSSKASELNVLIIKPEDTGLLIMTNNLNQPVIYQLIDSKMNVTKEIKATGQVEFREINPGMYQVRMIIDSNQNGKWDSGNYFTKQKPESIIYYKNEKGDRKINLKANWELGPLLITTE